MKRIVTVSILAFVVSFGAFAQEVSTFEARVQELKAEIQTKQNAIGNVKAALRDARAVRNGALVRVAISGPEFAILSYGTASYARRTRAGTTWAQMTAERLGNVDINKPGKFAGAYPRFLYSRGGALGARVIGLGTLATGAILAAVEGWEFTKSSIVFLVQESQVLKLQTQLQLVEEQFSDALGDLNQLEETR